MPANLIQSRYDKPFLTIEQQIDLLHRRGMKIENRNRASLYLQRIAYYYLSGYMYPFRVFEDTNDAEPDRHRGDHFAPGTTFDHVISLYVFDKKLKLLVIDAIERIELALRVDIAYQLGAKDPFAHYKSEFVLDQASKPGGRNGRTPLETWCLRRDRAVQASSAQFVAHVRSKYGLPLPIWIDVELWSLGEVSHFFEMMRVQDKTIIARRYSIPRPRLLQSWLRSICFVRNVASHHGRLWNRNMVDYPMMPRASEIPAFDDVRTTASPERLYVTLCIIAHFMHVLCPNSGWFRRVADHLDTFPEAPVIHPKGMGFPESWRNHHYWALAP